MELRCLNFSVLESIVIGGKSTKVKKWMAFKKKWIADYYLNPLVEFQNSCFRAKGIHVRIDLLGGRSEPPDVVVCCHTL